VPFIHLFIKNSDWFWCVFTDLIFFSQRWQEFWRSLHICFCIWSTDQPLGIVAVNPCHHPNFYCSKYLHSS
jgi:hypothetical protein